MLMPISSETGIYEPQYREGPDGAPPDVQIGMDTVIIIPSSLEQSIVVTIFLILEVFLLS